MNKREFISAVSALQYKKGYGTTTSYEEDNAYDKCRSEVTKLAEQLDENGLTFEGYQLLRSQTDDLVKVYKELGRVNNELFDSYKQNRELIVINKNLENNIKEYTKNSIKDFANYLYFELKNIKPDSITSDTFYSFADKYIKNVFDKNQNEE